LFTSDTLLSLAGLAALFTESFECDYLARLWKQDIQGGLA
jgi:hypothetical protein